MNLQDLSQLIQPLGVTKERLSNTLCALTNSGLKFQITGSLGLNILGVVDRPIFDLDIVIPTPQQDILLKLADNESENASVRKGDIAMGSAYYCKKLDGVPLCIFNRNNLKSIKKEFMGNVYEICDPAYAIEAKLAILKNRLFLNSFSKEKAAKHCADITAFFKWVNAPEKVIIYSIPKFDSSIPEVKVVDDELPW